MERLSGLRRRVLDELAMGRSPEQIAGRLGHQGAEYTVSQETIYAYVFSPAGRRLKLHRDLASRKAERGRRARRGRAEPMIPNRWPTHARPPGAHPRTRPGHREGGLLHCRARRAALLTLVERRSRFMLARRITDKRPAGVAAAVHVALGRLPARLRRTITLDNGGEFHRHERFPLAAYFCDPHAAWQRGSVENANGVIRRSLPRHPRRLHRRGHRGYGLAAQHDAAQVPRLPHTPGSFHQLTRRCTSDLNPGGRLEPRVPAQFRRREVVPDR